MEYSNLKEKNGTVLFLIVELETIALTDKPWNPSNLTQWKFTSGHSP